jgi:glycosyltransferase involved in cell wall biosynthesis
MCVPSLFLAHNVLPHETRPWDIWLARKTLGLGCGYVVQSQDEHARLLSLLPGRRVEVVPHPVHYMFVDQSLPQDEARQRLGIPPSAPVLLFFGFVREYKGLRYLLEAMPLVRAALADVQLLIVGEFWQGKQAYLNQIQCLEIERNVIIVDQYVSNEDIPTYFSAAAVVVLPYIQVTQSAVVQLAFGFGVPVITTRVGGLPEVVVDGLNGLLVEPQDPPGLAWAIIRYFETAGLEQALRENIHRQSGKKEWERLTFAIEHLARGDDHA